ncbi:hypothetical protein BGX27_000075 [Mortierella sp. AM989]|nr:hypothetical protein BGX27_000075 [Mortierella sp. AM989]
MLPSTTSNNAPSSHTVHYQQQYDSDADKDSSTLTSTSTPASPGRSFSSSYPHSQLQNNSSAGYLSPLNAQHSSVPQIRSPLAMSFNSQGNSNGTAFNTRSSYNTRIRGRRDSFQQSPIAFSPTTSHNSPNSSSQMNLNTGTSNLYSQQSRLGYLWSGTGSNIPAGGNRNRCLSTSSVDSSTSSVGLSHLAPALAAMSVQHNQQGSATNSPYQSYNSSPQQGNFHNHYQQQQSSSESSYPYNTSPFSSPLSQSQVPAYDSLSIAATNIATSIYGTTPPTHSATNMMYGSPSHYGSVSAASAQSYNSTARYGSSSILPLAPSLYPETDSTTGSNGSRAFEYADQYQQSQGQYYGQPTQQGLGILVTGGMARGMSSTPENEDEDGQKEQHSGMKHNTSVSDNLQTADDIQAIIGKDGKTLVYICPKCDPSKVVEFTTKSNLKRHLENKNIHNTPYERRRDQKRWQGHEKKQVSRDETTLRMRKWRNCNPEKNRFNDMRCRVYRNARKIYGENYSEAKEEYIRSEIERRKQNMIIRNSRRAEWANQTANNSNGSVGDSSESPSASPISASATTTGSVGYQMQDTFMFNDYESNSSMMVSQQIPSYGTEDISSPSSVHDWSSKSDKRKPDESKFLQDLKENRLPPRRRSRSAMHTTPNNSNEASANSGTATVSEASFGSLAAYTDNLTTDSFGYSASSPQQPAIRRLRNQRSVTDNSDVYRQNQTFANTGALGGYSSVIGGPYQSYMDSNQQLQMLEQKYSASTIPQGQENLDSVVEAMEISQAIGLTANNDNSGTTASTGGLYGDRDASAWLTSPTTYNSQTLAGSTQPEDGSRGFPFPVIRDSNMSHRKELARAAGIRLDIPQQHPFAPNQWINGINSATSADDMVGGSATSLESSALNHDHSPMANSPLSAALSSGNNNGRGDDYDDDREGGHNNNNNNTFRNNGANQYKSMTTKTKGSNFEVFGMPSVQMPLYGQSLSTSESGFFTTESAPMSSENNYLAKDQGVARRHSTAMANLSCL